MGLLQTPANPGAGRHYPEHSIGYRDVDIVFIGGDTPLHAAQRAAFADSLLPDHSSIAIGIKRQTRLGLLCSDQNAFAVGKLVRTADDPEIQVRSLRLRTVPPRGRSAQVERIPEVI